MTNPESKGLNGDIAVSPLTEEEKIEWQKRRWKNRRRMAWSSVFALLAIILLFFFAPIPESRLAIIVEPISMMAFVFGGVIGAYMGFTTIEKMKLGK